MHAKQFMDSHFNPLHGIMTENPIIDLTGIGNGSEKCGLGGHISPTAVIYVDVWLGGVMVMALDLS